MPSRAPVFSSFGVSVNERITHSAKHQPMTADDHEAITLLISSWCLQFLFSLPTMGRMIDFNNSAFFKLSETDPQAMTSEIAPLLVEGEDVLSAFKGIRDSVIFTNKRVIAINVQGMTGKKHDYTSLPYSKVQAFSVETAGTFDMDAELDLWFSGLGTVRFEFKDKVDIRALAQLIGSYVL